MEKLSENADPPEAIEWKALCVCAPLRAILYEKHQQPSDVQQRGREVVYLIWEGVQDDY